MLKADQPALVLAPMEGITDAPMRALQGESGAFSYAVSEFMRVANEPLQFKVFQRDIPELTMEGQTPSGLPIQVQILGGDAGRMAQSAVNACLAGASAIDINFGCPAPTVNRHDGGASLLREPRRVREVVAAVRDAVPPEIPVSAKLRLGWDSIDSIFENATMAAEGGASWLTIHARTKMQNYAPPVHWGHIGRVREMLNMPIIANGDIWTLDDFHRCQDATGCHHFMIGRGALANPNLAVQVSRELGIYTRENSPEAHWYPLLQTLSRYTEFYSFRISGRQLARLKQWLKLASIYGDFAHFEIIKRTQTIPEFFACLAEVTGYELAELATQ